MASSTGLSGGTSGNSSSRATPGWAMSRGQRPVCGQDAACTRNGWHRKTSPARPVASAVGRDALASAAIGAACVNGSPSAPNGDKTRAASRCEPGRTRVGALPASTSLNRYSASSGLLDFECAMTGDRAYEFAAAGLFVSRGDPRLLGRILAAYGRSFDPRELLAYTLLHVHSNLPECFAELLAAPEPTLDSLALTWFGAA